METKKHIINLPENKVAENISVKTENNQIIVNYNLKEKFNLKKGEIYYVESTTGNKFICIYKEIANHYFRNYASLFNLTCLYCNHSGINADCHVRNIIYIRKVTLQEKESLFNTLAKEGKQWNAKKMCVEDILNPKDGDFLADEDGNVFIYSSESISKDTFGCYCGTYEGDGAIGLSKSLNWTFKEGCRYATELEKQEFLEKLKEAGYTWNSEKKCLEEYIWKLKKGEKYFYIGINLKVYSNNYYDTHIDYLLISVGNCFQTEEQAEKKAKELKEVLKKK